MSWRAGLLLCLLTTPAWAEANDVAVALSAAKSSGLSAYQTAVLLCVRVVENGGDGKQYGVLSVPAPTHQAQARVAAQSIKRRVQSPSDLPAWAQRWCPVGAENDNGSNKYWLTNMQTCLAQLQPLFDAVPTPTVPDGQ